MTNCENKFSQHFVTLGNNLSYLGSKNNEGTFNKLLIPDTLGEGIRLVVMEPSKFTLPLKFYRAFSDYF